jgi:hypothetical protein
VNLARVSLVLFLVFVPNALRADASEGHLTGSLPEHHAEDADAAVVTEANLLASERFWPYHVVLTRSWQPGGRDQPLGPGSRGVLIRVEPSGLTRIDFGRDGLYEAPVSVTDVVERANRIRLGEQEKMAPNFLLAIGPRLLDSASASLRPFRYSVAAESYAFLCIFADPGAEGFSDLAAVLAPLHGRSGVLTILLPQGTHPDGELREKLRSLQWMVPFVSDHLAEAYTRSLLPEETPLPAVMLQTGEGRVVFQSGWRAGLLPELTSMIDDVFGGTLSTAPRG